jgi:hypothetical protein
LLRRLRVEIDDDNAAGEFAGFNTTEELLDHICATHPDFVEHLIERRQSTLRRQRARAPRALTGR